MMSIVRKRSASDTMLTYNGPCITYGDSPDGSEDVFGHEPRPVSEAIYVDHDTPAVKLKQKDGRMLVFYRDGGIELYINFGLKKYWYPKPTIRDAVLTYAKGMTVMFAPSGEVTVKTSRGEILRWGVPYHTEAVEEGTIVPGVWDGDEWFFWDDQRFLYKHGFHSDDRYDFEPEPEWLTK